MFILKLCILEILEPLTFNFKEGVTLTGWNKINKTDKLRVSETKHENK